MTTNQSIGTKGPLVFCLLFAALPAWAQQVQEVKPSLELQVFLHDKLVGSETLRSTKCADALCYSTVAQLQDKVNKVWRSFKQRSHLQLTPQGEVSQFDRWIDVTGATQSTKLFNFNGQWRIAVTEAAFEGKKAKPKVSDVKATQPLVVLDERLPALVAVAAERMGDKASFDYVRVDNATYGKLTRTREALVTGKGHKYSRDRLKADKFEVWVLRDAGGKVVAVQGLDGWRGVAKDAKVPTDLQVDAAAKEGPAGRGKAPAQGPVSVPGAATATVAPAGK